MRFFIVMHSSVFSRWSESYLSHLAVHPAWRGNGLATFMLYHLIQTNLGKDLTLHVSASNPALLLYQKFGFKVTTGPEMERKYYQCEKRLRSLSPTSTHDICLQTPNKAHMLFSSGDVWQQFFPHIIVCSG